MQTPQRCHFLPAALSVPQPIKIGSCNAAAIGINLVSNATVRFSVMPDKVNSASETSISAGWDSGVGFGNI